VGMSYADSNPLIGETTTKHNEDFDLGLEVRLRASSSASGGSDHAPFAAKDIPYFYFMAGFPPEYHQPNDHIELVNIPKMTNIIKLGFLNTWEFANTDAWREKARP